ncbi:MAG: protein kinase [Candidatus Obscuribacterales bacterium]|nr:protein kinase [Candidatus Obscuribacterales bacterium]
MNAKNPEDTGSRKVCIACKQEFSADVTKCPHDGTVLTPVTSEPSVGSIIAGKYEVLSIIGGGAMGLVYKARHTLMKRVVAVKVLRPNMALDETTVSRFQKESEALSVLDHPNILKVFDFGLNEQGQPYLVTDYLEGDTLADLLNRDERIDYKRAIELFKQASSALSHAHKNGVIHRDMKPSNIMLVKDDEGNEMVKILDFGIAKVSDDAESSTQLTKTGEVFGSPLYMSPEQCRGKKLDARSDIYSVGCVLYRSLVGAPPIIGQDLIECLYKHVNEDPASFAEAFPGNQIPAALEAVVMKCLMKDPALRYQSMNELRDALLAVEDKDALEVGTGTGASASIVSTGATSAISSAAVSDETIAPSTLLQQPGQDAVNTGNATVNTSTINDTTSVLADTTPDTKSAIENTSASSGMTPTGSLDPATLLKDKRVLIGIAVVAALLVIVPVTGGLMSNNKEKKGDAGDSKNSNNPYDELIQDGVDEYESGDYFEARSNFYKAYTYASKEKLDKAKQALALHHLIAASAESQEYDMAATYLRELEKIAAIKDTKSIPESQEAAEVYFNKALLMMYGKGDNLKEAQTLVQKARGYYEAHEGHSADIMRCLSALGQIKILMGDFEAASAYMKQAVMLAKEDPTVSQLEMALRMDGLGDAFILVTNRSGGKVNYYDKAKKEYEEALQLRKDTGGQSSDKSLSQSYLRLGIINYLQNNFDEAVKNLNKSLEIREKYGRPLQIAEVKRALSKVLLAQGKKDEATKVFQESIELAKEGGPQMDAQIKKWQAVFDAMAKRVR